MGNGVSGTAGSVAIINGGTATVGGVKEWSLDLGQETPETTAFTDQWKTYINGIREWSGSLSLNGDPTNTAQGTVRAALMGGSAPFLARFHAGTNQFSGTIIPTGISPSLSYDGIWEESFDFQGTGPLTYS